MDATSPPSATALLTREDRLSAWLPGVVLAAAVCIAYLRVWHAGFIWDDDDHLTRNPCIVGPLGFGDIWTSSRAVYYPLVLTSFWVQHALWGLAPLPYHLVNVALHAACAVLLWRVLLRLRVAGAWLGAALWALHPVQVETAAWVTEQKNTQSCLFYLLAILFFLQWRETARKFATGEPPEGFPRTRRYVMALVCALLAILSKSSTVMLPVVLGLCWWWMEYREEPKRRRGRRWLSGIARWLAPFFMVAAVASAWTVWEQKYANHALGAEWSQTWPERGIIAGRDVWFYLWKLAWPHPLTFIYPQWTIDANHASAFLPLMGVACGLALLWMGRDGILRPVFFAAAYFVISLFPVLSFFNVYFFRYSFVGDHFQYLASIGPLALAGAAITWVCQRLGGLGRIVYPAVSAALLMVLGGLTYLQCGIYHDLEALWRNTLADNPGAWIAHFNLADILVREGRLDEAAGQYEEQLRLMPSSEEGRGNLANVRVLQGRLDDAIAQFDELLLLDPDSAEGHGNLAAALLHENRVAEAIEHAQRAVELSRHTDETGEGHNNPAMLQILAIAYARGGRFPEAIQAARMALQRAQQQSNAELVEALKREVVSFQASAKALH